MLCCGHFDEDTEEQERASSGADPVAGDGSAGEAPAAEGTGGTAHG